MICGSEIYLKVKIKSMLESLLKLEQVDGLLGGCCTVVPGGLVHQLHFRQVV